MQWDFRIFILLMLLLGGCGEESHNKKIIIGTSANYPPFEFRTNGELVGFDIDLGKLVAKELNLEIKFSDMQFSSLLPALENGHIDAIIATVTITDERKKSFDFSDSYHNVALAAVFKSGSAIHNKEDLAGKSVACQLGTTMEIWLKDEAPLAKVTTFDNNNQAIELLKTGQIDAVIIDAVQGYIFSKNNPGLDYQIIDRSDQGYGIAVKKGSDLLIKINQALKNIDARGEIAKLKTKWLGE